MNYHVVIPAAGQGKRMGASKNKLLLELEEIPIIIYTLNVFEKDPNCEGVILAVNPIEKNIFEELLIKYQIQKVIAIVNGGLERQNSVFNGIKLLKDDGYVLIHDGARPFVDQTIISQLVKSANKSGAAVVAVPVKDTIKKVKKNTVVQTMERSSLWAVQTPQAFRISLLMNAHESAIEKGFLGTDDASLIEELGHEVVVVLGNYDNIKLTTPEDLMFAKVILEKSIRG